MVGKTDGAEEMISVPCPAKVLMPPVNWKVERSKNASLSMVIARLVEAMFPGSVTVRPAKISTLSPLAGMEDPACVVPLGSVVQVVAVFQLPFW